MVKARLRLSWTDRLVEHLADKGYDRRYGARPLQRVLETLVVTPLARFLVGNPSMRNRQIRLDLDTSGTVTLTALQ